MLNKTAQPVLHRYLCKKIPDNFCVFTDINPEYLSLGFIIYSLRIWYFDVNPLVQIRYIYFVIHL